MNVLYEHLCWWFYPVQRLCWNKVTRRVRKFWLAASKLTIPSSFVREKNQLRVKLHSLSSITISKTHSWKLEKFWCFLCCVILHIVICEAVRNGDKWLSFFFLSFVNSFCFCHTWSKNQQSESIWKTKNKQKNKNLALLSPPTVETE